MTFTSVADFKNQLIRKGLQGILLVADYSTAALTTISGSGGALTIPGGYTSLGKLHSDGAERSVDTDVSEILGWGDVSSSRTDVQKRSTELDITALETRKKVLGLLDNVDLTSVTADANFEAKWDQPASPALIDYRVLLLVRDINKANGLDVYLGIHFPKANFVINGSQKMTGNGDDALNYPMKVKALIDDAAGTAVRTFWAGPGMQGLKSDMGF